AGITSGEAIFDSYVCLARSSWLLECPFMLIRPIRFDRPSLSVGIRGHLCPVPAQIHAAPDARTPLARVVEMKHTAAAFSNARYRCGRQQVCERIRERRECLFGPLWSEISAPLKARTTLYDLIYVRIRNQQSVHALNDAQRQRRAPFEVQHRLSSALPELPELLYRRLKRRARPTPCQTGRLAVIDQPRSAQPA